MTDCDALLKAISDTPDDDLPRLVFADWLDEHGEPYRAEFIRVGCEKRQPAVIGSAYRTLETRSQELLLVHGGTWQQELPQFTRSLSWGEYSRGFIEDAKVADIRVLVRYADDIFLRTPLREIELASAAHLEQLADLAYLHRLEVISIPTDDVNLQALSDNFNRLPDMPRLRSIDLFGCHAGVELAYARLRNRYAKKLRVNGSQR